MIAQEIQNYSNMPMDLCELLRTMSLAEASKSVVVEHPKESQQRVEEDAVIQDEFMSDGSQSDTASECSTQSETYGCAYLKAIQAQLDQYPTTGGDYLEAIFTHREILAAYPSSHRDCARGFSDIAFSLERRAWRADRDADTEAVMAFRHEAWMIAATLQTQGHEEKQSSPADTFTTASERITCCVMQPVF